MGAVYDVELNLKYRSAQDVVDATRNFVDNFGESASFSDTDFTDIRGALECIFTKRGLHINTLTDTTAICDSGFDASYGWETVMTDWFDYTAAVLEDGSEFKIFPDNGYYSGVVNNGKVNWSELEEEDGDLEYAIDLINQYLISEFDHGISDDDDLSDIGLMYTTAGDYDEVELQVSANLNNYTINYYVNGDLRHTDQFEDLQDMIESELENWEGGFGVFDGFYGACLDYVTDEDYLDQDPFMED